MKSSRVIRSLSTAAVAAVLLTGVACGPRDRLARPTSATSATSAPVTTVAGATTPTAPAATSPGPGVRTDDLDADLQQADSQLTQTGGAVSDADQNTQQLSD